MSEQQQTLTIQQALTLAVQHHNAGRLSEAENIYQQILQNDPNQPMASHLLGVIAHQSGNNHLAAELITKAVAIKPDFPEAYNNLGLAFHALGKPNEAMESYYKALELKPSLSAAHCNLGDTLRALGRLDEAVTHSKKAVQIQPDLAEAHNTLGVVLRDRQRVEEAIASFQSALHIKPNYPEAHRNLASALRQLGQLEEAITCCRKALDLKPNDPQAHSDLLVMEQYRLTNNSETLYGLHREWDERHGRMFRTVWPQHTNTRVPDRRLRVGFVSPDLKHHPVGYFVIGLFEHFIKDDIETIVYSSSLTDNMTKRITAASDIWHDVRWTSDEELAQKILADEVDILVDLSGHYTNNRLLVFARKPAPLQVTWAGYVGTTGLSSIDYLVSDRHSTRVGEEKFFSEKILRMPNGWLCYTPPDYAPDVGPLPLIRNGYVTFASFSTRLKLNVTVIDSWATILKKVPESQLLVKFLAIDTNTNIELLTKMFDAKGVDRSRLRLEGWSPHLELLARYNEVDIALDPFPYSGGLTTYEALWMGVPVITVPGKTFASRHAFSHLSTMGLTELVARHREDYVKLAVELASDTDRLTDLRTTIRGQMANSPVCDSRTFAQDFAKTLRKIWRNWCSSRSADHISGS